MISDDKISVGQYVGRSGFIDYNDTDTALNPISIGTTFTNITNDGLGTDSNKMYSPIGDSDIYDTTNNRYDFSSLKLGDMVSFRLNVTVTTTVANQELWFSNFLGHGGTGTPYSSTNKYFQFKTAGTYPITIDSYFDIGNENTLDNYGGFYMRSDDTLTLINHGVRFQITLY